MGLVEDDAVEALARTTVIIVPLVSLRQDLLPHCAALGMPRGDR
jgi:hypothetical protein